MNILLKHTMSPMSIAKLIVQTHITYIIIGCSIFIFLGICKKSKMTRTI